MDSSTQTRQVLEMLQQRLTIIELESKTLREMVELALKVLVAREDEARLEII